MQAGRLRPALEAGLWWIIRATKLPALMVSPLTIDFDHDIPRNGTNSVKHDGRASYFGTPDVLPLWVADMDFASPEAVTRALQERAAHPIYGYTQYSESAYEALLVWLKKRHGWEVQREWIVMAPGVVPSLFASVMAFVREGEGVIVQPPVYFPFFSAVTTNHRKLIENPLRLARDRYLIDFDDLEHCAVDGGLMLFCSPHNPVGRVWTKAELTELLHAGAPVYTIADLLPGDLLLIPGSAGTAASPRHVGMYLGDGLLIDAPQTGDVVKIENLAGYWQTNLAAMRHIG